MDAIKQRLGLLHTDAHGCRWEWSGAMGAWVLVWMPPLSQPPPTGKLQRAKNSVKIHVSLNDQIDRQPIAPQRDPGAWGRFAAYWFC
jgi:hypothetical protein